MTNDRTQLMSARALPAGYQLEYYTIESTLGQGGFGITYLAHDRNLDRHVAIKEYLPTTFAFRQQDSSVKPITGDMHENYSWGLNNFLNEAKTLAKFGHDNIVRVHNFFQLNNTAYMVMEYEQGDSLSSVYNSPRQLDQAFLEQVYFPIFDGLKHIHEFGFIHRDIKPSNIFIRHNGTAVLIDFGSARETDKQFTGEMTTLVSQGYTPLEQYSANYGEQGPWTDIYAIAASIYEGIAGVKPEEALSRSACLMRSRPDPIEALDSRLHPGFSDQFLASVMAGLRLQPEERPQTLDEWLLAFQNSAAPQQSLPQLGDSPFAQDANDATRAMPKQRQLKSATDRSGLNDVADSGIDSHQPLNPALANDDVDFFGQMPSSVEVSSNSGRRSEKKRKPGSSLFMPSVLLLMVVGAVAAGWWFLTGQNDKYQPLDKKTVASLPVPAQALEVTLPEEAVVAYLGEMKLAADMYREALEMEPDSSTLRQGVSGLKDRIQEVIHTWLPTRNSVLDQAILSVVTGLPLPANERDALQASIDRAETANSDDVLALVNDDFITRPVGGSVLDKAKTLDAANYQDVISNRKWQSMMLSLRRTAVEEMREGDFEAAVNSVALGLALQPDSKDFGILREHMMGR